jgi:hemolysin III
MGWIALIAIKPMLELIPNWGLFWLVAGGFFTRWGWAFLPPTRGFATGTLCGTCLWRPARSCHFVAVLYYAS